MPRLLVLPHKSISMGQSDGFESDEWLLNGLVVDQVEFTPRFLFSPAETVRFGRSFICRPGIIAEELDQGPLAEFVVSCEPRSSRTGLRRILLSEEFTGVDRDIRLSIDELVEGSELGGTVFLTTRLLVVKPDAKSDVAAKAVGDVLLREECIISLEREIATFPHFEPANLNGYLGLDPGPPWIVDVDLTDLSVDASQVVTVSVNERSVLAPAVIDGADSSTAYRRSLACDIARALISAALASDEFCQCANELTSNPFQGRPRSLGAVLRQNLLTHGFSGTVDQVRAMRETQSLEFEARIVNRSMRP